jgi:hypothetical protein
MSDRPPELQPIESVMPDHEPQASADRPDFADLSLAEVLALGVRAPRRTWLLFWETLHNDASVESIALPADLDVQKSTGPRQPSLVYDRSGGLFLLTTQTVSLWLMVVGLALGIIGSTVMASGTNRTELRELSRGAPWLLLGFGLWLAAAIVANRDNLRAWRAGLQARSRRDRADAPDESSPPEAAARRQRISFAAGVERYGVRLMLAGFGILLSLAAYAFNGNNTFTGFGVFVWIVSIVVWLAALTPVDFDVVAWAQARRDALVAQFQGGLRLRFSWTVLALLLIMLVGIYFRFAQLAVVPPEMTSDHVEKLLDAQRVLDGTTQVFFPNNGGREPMQMYLVAFFSQISGLGMQFLTLKWVSILEGLITIPVLWWLGREIIGEEQPRLGNAVGLILAGLVAVSYWHVALSRLALRIVLTPLVMSLVTIYLVRGMRHNRRADFLKAGVALGIGVYCYQAVRMIPVVVVLGVALAFIFRARSWAARRTYIYNLTALVIITIVIFVPLGRFMLESPNLFWMRTAGRLFGDDVITETDEITGAITERDATLQDRLDAFSDNLDVLGMNLRNVLLMFNWKGDVAWINGAPNEPAMDPLTGTLFILGLAAWVVRMIRRRDVVDWLILPALFVMLLPSALSVAFPVENPSATRTSGALPFAYLLAAYGLAVLLVHFEQTFREKAARYMTVGAAVVFIVGAFGYNTSLYFGDYVERYTIAAQPYEQTGRILRGFAESNGSYGNAFMVAHPYWLDHRAIGIEAGRIDWPNGLLSIDDLAQKIRDNGGTAYSFAPDRAVLFIYNARDEETPERLAEWFPQGSSLLQTADMPVKDFYTFIAPPPGDQWVTEFMTDALAE